MSEILTFVDIPTGQVVEYERTTPRQVRVADLHPGDVEIFEDDSDYMLVIHRAEATANPDVRRVVYDSLTHTFPDECEWRKDAVWTTDTVCTINARVIYIIREEDD